jgi:hypothetical protein
LIQILLALGQFTEPGEELELFPLLFGGWCRGLALGLVAVFGVPELELVQLALGPAAGAASGAARLAAGDLVFTGLELEQGFVGGLFGVEGVGQRVCRALLHGVVEVLDGALHFVPGGCEELGRTGIGGIQGQLQRLIEGMMLGLADDGGILDETLGDPGDVERWSVQVAEMICF